MIGLVQPTVSEKTLAALKEYGERIRSKEEPFNFDLSKIQGITGPGFGAARGNAGPTGKQTDPDSDEWCTPKWLADALGRYDLDPCSNSRSHINAALRLSKEEDGCGLSVKWLSPESGAEFLRANRRGFSIWINPPYSDVMPWAERAVEASHCHASVDVLVKLDPTTRWWAKLMEGSGVSIRAFRKRLKFERPGKPPLTANFPSALVSMNRGGMGPTSLALWDHTWGPW